jgi:hypothetical protein
MKKRLFVSEDSALWCGDFQGISVYRSDVIDLGVARKATSTLAIIVSIAHQAIPQYECAPALPVSVSPGKAIVAPIDGGDSRGISLDGTALFSQSSS